MNEIITNFNTAMLDAGITPPESIIADGKLHRFKIDGKLNGAYVLHMDGVPAGYFEDFKQGIKETWKMSGQPLSELQKKAFKTQCQGQAEYRHAQELARQAHATHRAVSIWSYAKPAPDSHPYLLKKRIKHHGARLGRDNTLIIPLYSSARELVNLQFIGEDGTKRFLSGGRKKACFYALGKAITPRVLVCEGFATGATLHEESGYLTVIAFDAGNLKEVAIVVKSLWPDAEIIVCGDNDLSGVGEEKARQAALAINCKYIIPKIAGHDFNDMLTMEVV